MALQQIDNLLKFVDEYKLSTSSYSNDDQKSQSPKSPKLTLKDKDGKIIFSIPQCGLGTWKSDGDKVRIAVEYAIKIGYRHIDCAKAYNNEKFVGQAINNCIKQGIVKRNELFITSKLPNPFHERERVFEAINDTLKNLSLDYIDLYLMHWAMSFEYPGTRIETNNDKQPFLWVTGKVISLQETWKAMEECVDKGYCKYLGISNFNHKQVDELLSIKGLKYRPMNLQNESSIYNPQEKMLKFLKERNITFTGYSPLASNDTPWKKETDPNIFKDEVVNKIANKYNKSIAQIALKYQQQRGVIIIPKSVTTSRIKENFDLFSWNLSDDDMESLKKLDRNWRGCIPPAFPRDHPYWPFNEEY